ncbi:MAG TPA: sugar ABC transporter permease [Ktedonobacteraceae bacterium]|jgi:ABC-type sugar transport system permease subunit|nr:sugar ABC transporter permease [Ktedonobacteraceae bacterium]
MSDISIQEQAAKAKAQTGDVLARTRANRWRVDLAGYGFLLPFLIAYALFLIWPAILMLRMSFFNWSLDGHGTTDFLGLANYGEVLSDPSFWQALWNTIVFTVISTPALVIISFILALLVNRAIPAKGVFRTIFFAPFIIPVSVVTIIWSWLYEPGFGLINGTLAEIGIQNGPNWLTQPGLAMIAIVILTVWWTVGFNFVLYLSGMQQISRDLYDAASIDGAGGWARTRWITIPLLGRITLMIVILQIIASLQVFGQIYLLTAGGPNFSTRPVIQYIYESGFSTFRVGFASAMSFIFFILVAVISAVWFSILQRQQRGNN